MLEDLFRALSRSEISGIDEQDAGIFPAMHRRQNGERGGNTHSQGHRFQDLCIRC